MRRGLGSPAADTRLTRQCYSGFSARHHVRQDSIRSRCPRLASTWCGCWYSSPSARCWWSSSIARSGPHSSPIRAQRPDHRRAADRHPAGIPPGACGCFPRSPGSTASGSPTRPCGRARAGAARADGGDPARPRRPHGDVVADHAQPDGFDREPARRSARHVALHDRPPGLPRPARHLLGPDRDRRLGRQGDRGPQGRRRRRRDVRSRSRRASRRRSAAWGFRSRPRCSASPVR